MNLGEMTRTGTTFRCANGDCTISAGTIGGFSSVTLIADNVVVNQAPEFNVLRIQATNSVAINAAVSAQDTEIRAGSVCGSQGALYFGMNGSLSGTAIVYTQQPGAIADGKLTGVNVRVYQLIDNVAELQSITQAGTHALNCDIDASATMFTPITFFDGVFDGQMHAIVDLRVATNADGGLINNLSGTVRNLILVRPVINTTQTYAGSLARRSTGTVSDVLVLAADLAGGGRVLGCGRR